ncbi:LytR/AlgR family response regulator transcription factor [Clostridium tetani]|uniref:LytR/AlgR family response regulator transcription factor n=1 Tax=Clostridium tetani TaxID=1513 RepID=UPI0005140DE0|nr:LytTR family DNA-binding domain-containing protein [Clostridium tetani]KGI44790.1 transcriptional regulator [Clostridium tetani]RXI73858.1 DNA-binding response regulator [Clostridium tetani]BDR87315.1 DNA-binding response regulator [Clostridium tetani]
MNKINCVIIEDEIPSADELNYTLKNYNFINIVGIAHDGIKGLELIKNLNPHGVFLDINMPSKNGMELAKEIKTWNENIEIIFITAYDKYALKAFEIHALDYILKPFEEERINIAVNRLLEIVEQKKSDEDIPKILDKLLDKLHSEENLIEKIPCDHFGKIILVPLSQIYFCYTEKDKVYIKTYNKEYISNYTLNKLQKKTKFFRAHRSYLVNLNNIKELFSWFNGTYKLVMKDDKNTEIPISRGNVKHLKDILDF